jgi:hypothetical protein
MTEKIAIKADAEVGAPRVQNLSGLENFAPGPDSYVDLQYNEHKNPDYIRVSARNHHPYKTIHAYFYTLHEKGGHFVPGKTPQCTIKACLKPAETTVIHFEEKKHHPKLFLFNAFFDDCD